ncbi:MAG: NPCBM/NEW2 domain-containing protein [Candidatus Aminicenantia bacterium]
MPVCPACYRQATGRVEFDITGVKSLRLHVSDGGDGKDWDHADWVEAKISKNN